MNELLDLTIHHIACEEYQAALALLEAAPELCLDALAIYEAMVGILQGAIDGSHVDVQYARRDLRCALESILAGYGVAVVPVPPCAVLAPVAYRAHQCAEAIDAHESLAGVAAQLDNAGLEQLLQRIDAGGTHTPNAGEMYCEYDREELLRQLRELW